MHLTVRVLTVRRVGSPIYGVRLRDVGTVPGTGGDPQAHVMFDETADGPAVQSARPGCLGPQPRPTRRRTSGGSGTHRIALPCASFDVSAVQPWPYAHRGGAYALDRGTRGSLQHAEFPKPERVPQP